MSRRAASKIDLDLLYPILIMLATMMVLVPGCTRLDPVLTIGLVAPFEGEEREIGYDIIYSARLAVRQANEGGGIAGYRIALSAVDNLGNPEYNQKIAKSFELDKSVIAVIGYWAPGDAASVGSLYKNGNLTALNLQVAPFGKVEAETLPSQFVAQYEEVTPFDETPGEYAAAMYDAMQLLFEAIEISGSSGEKVDRASIRATLSDLRTTGLSGLVYYKE